MRTLLGIDLGTSSIKIMLFDVKQGVVAVVSKAYGVNIPMENHAEQDPHIWWNAATKLLLQLSKRYPKAFAEIAGIGLSGQMHGLVALNRDGALLRPAIIWLDQRSCKEVAVMKGKITEMERKKVLQNPIYPGFMFPSLLWIKNHEPNIYQRIDKVVQPKDYMRYRLTGCIGTDMSDASATAAFDVENRTWAWELIERLEIDKNLFPECRDSMEIAGYVTKACAAMCGLREGVPVIFGCGDQIAQSIGNGIISEGDVASNIGTGGQISTFSAQDLYDDKLRTHVFCHAIKGAYAILGATLSCGLSLQWLAEKILGIDGFDQCNQLAGEVEAGSGGLLYLPYLSGERTPIMNPQAKGVFFGLKLEHDKRHLIRAVMEGIVFSLKDSLVLLDEMGIQSDLVIASGGGAVSNLLLQIQADIFEKTVKVCSVKEQACLGACLLAGVGIGAFPDIKTACRQFVTFQDAEYRPNPKTRDVYQKHYELYHDLYRQTKSLMKNGG